jgi:adenylate cyclase
MGLFIRITHHRLRQGEVLAKLELRREIRGREKVIKTKTEESIKLQKLSSQFSPQVVEAIRVGDIRLDGNVKRAQICALFIDIVGSTDRVVRLDRDEFDAVLKRFMEVSFGVLLKYDLTIDKFLGDGILAFSNEPVKRSDFISRTCYAAYEIKKRLEGEAEFFERRWRKPFQIRAGISTGYANVGFHGSEKYYKTYTAIGPPLALASRLCSTAEPNQIVVDNDVHEAVLRDNFVLKFIGKKTLKGFEDEIIFAYELNDAPAQEFVNDGAMNCTSCGNNVLTLEESGGIYYMKCRSCGFILDSNSELKASA